MYNFGLSECNRVKSTPYLERISLSSEANRKSQKLFPFLKMIEKHRDVPDTPFLFQYIC